VTIDLASQGERPLRILHVLRAPLGGLFRHVLDLTREQVARGHAVGLVVDSLTGGDRATENLAKLEPFLELGILRIPMRRAPHLQDIGAIIRVDAHARNLGVDVIHSRPYHPQGRGKNERFHRTLNQEVFAFQRFADQAAAQRGFDRWRDIYNFERPHEGIDYQTPADRYRPSVRPMPDKTPEAVYDQGEIVRVVPATKDYVSFKGRLWKVPSAFRGERVAIRPKYKDGEFGVFFGSHQIAQIDLTNPPTVRHLSEQP